MDSGSREENTSKQESGVDQRFHEKLKDSSVQGLRAGADFFAIHAVDKIIVWSPWRAAAD